MSKALTPEELREQFLDAVRGLVDYWAKLVSPERTQGDRLDGLAFSILNIFDGTSMSLPAFDIVARPHPDDKAYAKANDEDWIKDGTVINANCHLHDLYYPKKETKA